MTNPIWYFHIPKTAGRFFYANTIRVIEQELIIRGQQYSDVVRGFGHLSWRVLSEKPILSFATVREPVARTVSHWQHLYMNFPTECMKADTKKLLDFLESNPDSGIINYQTKMISYSGDTLDLGVEESELTTADLDLAKQRLATVSYLIDTDKIDHVITSKCLAIMRDYLAIPSKPYVETTMPNPRNANSARMFYSLAPSERKIIESYMGLDMDLYHGFKGNTWQNLTME